MINPGKDYSTFFRADGLPDMDLSFLEIQGARVVLELIARRLITPPGMMDDPEYGIDLRTYLNAGLLSGELGILEAAIRAEALKVEGVDDARVTATLDGQGGFLAVVEVVLADEDEDTFQFSFVLGADKVARIYMPETV